MKNLAFILAALIAFSAGCTKEYKLKPKPELSEALGQRIQQAFIDFALKNPEFSEYIGKTVEGRDIKIEDKFIPLDKTVEKYQQYGMLQGKQLFVGDWVLNQEKMVMGSQEVFENGTVFIYQAPFTIDNGEVKITKIRVDKMAMPAEK